MDVEMRIRPVALLAKRMSPLGKLMTGFMKKCVYRDMEELKAAAESGAEARAAS